MSDISSVNFTGDKSSLSKLQSALKDIDSSDIDISFGAASKIDRDYLEMIIEDHAKQTQNAALANKWIQIDTALEKELRRFKVAVSSLLTSVVETETAQAQAAQPQPGLPAQPGAVPGPVSPQPSMERKLPEPLV